MLRTVTLVVVSLLPAALGLSIVATPVKAADELPVVLKETFDEGADRWAPTDPAAWKLLDVEGSGKVFSQFQASKFKPPHRSPLNFALLKDVVVGDFVLEAKTQSTCREYNHRDVCVIFGYQDPAHFYYVHLGRKADDHANQIFIVNGADRKKISTKSTEGTPWTDGWHRVKIVRTPESGAIAIYFDDMEQAAMEASDKHFAWGQIGVGSFDDTSNWDDLVLRGKTVEPAKK